MLIEPVIKGVVARSSHPEGCAASVREQISYVKSVNSIVDGPKKVLVLGCSSGFGLASRIALTFGGAQADTIGVSFERGPGEKGVGSAGWYNNIAFREEAEREGRIAKNFVGDAFSQGLRQQVANFVREEFGGKVDLVVYSLATGVRPDPKTGELIRSSLKTLDEPYIGYMVNIEEEKLESVTVEPATPEELEATRRVMGGEDWENWIDFMMENDLLSQGAKTVSYSYIGSEITYPIYHHGTLGEAKKHLHSTGETLNQKLVKSVGGEAYVTVCKALVTKASVFIPGLGPYLMALMAVHKKLGLHERPIEQMQRLFGELIYGHGGSVPTDEHRLVRVDDWELRPDVQEEVKSIVARMTPENFMLLGDFDTYKGEFMQLNGFGYAGVDYSKEVDIEELKKLKP